MVGTLPLSIVKGRAYTTLHSKRCLESSLSGDTRRKLTRILLDWVNICKKFAGALPISASGSLSIHGNVHFVDNFFFPKKGKKNTFLSLRGKSVDPFIVLRLHERRFCVSVGIHAR